MWSEVYTIGKKSFALCRAGFFDIKYRTEGINI